MIIVDLSIYIHGISLMFERLIRNEYMTHI